MSTFVHTLGDVDSIDVCATFISEFLPCTTKPCRNNATCRIDTDSYACTCKDNYYGHHCEGAVICNYCAYQLYNVHL